jgi:hypothetical protein
VIFRSKFRLKSDEDASKYLEKIRGCRRGVYAIERPERYTGY